MTSVSCISLAALAISITVATMAEGQTASPASADLTTQAKAAIPHVRAALDEALNDYPSARFRNVRARFVHSAYVTDEGQSNKVPWMHRGGIVLVFCGEVNAKNRMGGYTGWEPFGLQPAQTDIVTLHSFTTPRVPTQTNIAEKPKFMSASGLFRDALALQCGNDAERIDEIDLSAAVTYQATR